MEVDGASQGRRELLMLILSNGAIFGGGFRVAPGASPCDGTLDSVGFHNMGAWKRLKLMAQLRRGTHERARETERTPGRVFRLRFDRPPTYETDGEWNQAASAELEVSLLPAVLPVLVP
jgi:diacylglycerol kinase (ATP)